ncbi:MAG: hypothetical protein HOM21_13825, partial [Halobacteriovoraceae bacterium]|nr:hypothetical protein [Halobacteriovoraceae bacterium]
LDQLLESKDSVLVKPGQYSGAVDALGKTSKPVKLSPVQLDTLYKNSELKEKSRHKKKSLTIKKDMRFVLKQAEQEAPPEGFFNKKTGDYAPKSGGVIDLNTGIYIPPSAESNFDEKKKIYIPKNIGQIDNETGQYIAPKGLKLDSKKGFVLKSEKKGKKKVLLALSNKLNNNIAKDVVLASKKSVLRNENLSIKVANNKEKYARDSISYVAQSVEHNYNTTGDQLSGDRQFKKSNALGFKIDWNIASNSKWQPIVGLGVKNVKFDDAESQNIGHGSGTLTTLNVGARFYYNQRLNFKSLLSMEQEHVMNHVLLNNSVNSELTKVNIPKLKLGLEFILIKAGRFFVDTELYGFYTASKKSGELKVDPGLGYGWKLGIGYWFNSNYSLSLGIRQQVEDHDIGNSSFRAKDHREEGGALLSLNYLF